jgi:hypothetical protein
MQHYATASLTGLPSEPKMNDIHDTLADDVGMRDTLNSWLCSDAFAPFNSSEPASAFSWANKQSERRRQREAQRRKVAA